MSTETEALATTEEQSGKKKHCCALRAVTWLSVGVAVTTAGILVGLELRSRYKFKRRTPYDFYANAGEQQTSEFGVGV